MGSHRVCSGVLRLAVLCEADMSLNKEQEKEIVIAVVAAMLRFGLIAGLSYIFMYGLLSLLLGPSS